VGLSRSSYYHEPVDWPTRDAEVIEALNGLVYRGPRFRTFNVIDDPNREG
jgi:hypothetical protein